MLVLILITIKLDPKIKNIDITIINKNIYCIAYYLKKALIFAILIKDILYWTEKKVKDKINLKNIISQNYNNFLIFF